MPRSEALKLVRPGLDLIEISANAKPPVARIMSYDKFRYMEAKAEKKERQGEKRGGMKQVQISARAASHDLEIKANQAKKFLEEGYQVDVQMRLRGREKGMKDWARGKMDEFLKMIPVEFKVLHPVKFGGRGLGVHIAKA
jgi:translation initiation factor IF-3